MNRAIPLHAVVLTCMCATATVAQTSSGPSGIDPAGVLQPHPDHQGYEAVIRRTAYGVAHIQAADLASLGFGEGYAQAEDHLCTIADQVVLARGERAMHFGRGDGDRHLVSDIAMRALRLHEGAEAWHAAQPAEVRGWVEGFVAGYNQYLMDTGADAVPGWCRGEPWVAPISVADLAAYHRLVTQYGPALATAIAAARPPVSGAIGPGAGPALASSPDLGEFFGRHASASNGWALGRDRTRSGGGLLVANPHYSWIGSNRFWEKHLTIPGEMDVYGANIIGVPGVLFGFNERVAWTHTVSAATTFTLYALDLIPGQPTRYRYGDQERAMEALELTIPVQGEADSIRHTAWRSHYGPMLAPPALQWTAEGAYTLRDATERYPSYLAQILATSRAASLAELQRAHSEHQATQRFATVAVDAGGTAWFLESAPTPDLGREALEAWADRLQRDPRAGMLWQVNRIALLDGSDPRFEWRTDPESPHPGVVPFQRLPQLERTDVVFNANNSFWVAHPAERIEGEFSPLHGAQRAPLGLRARQTALHLSERGAARVSRTEEMEAVLSNRSLAADLLRDELVERCHATPVISAGDRSVDLAAACHVLAAWDGRYDLDSRGAVLFREWLGHYDLESTMRVIQGRPNLFAVDFDPDDPLGTPRELAPGPLALENLAKAVALLAGRGLALDAPLGELQYAPSKLPRRLPVHGGNHWEGVLNLMLGTTGGSTLEPTPTSPPVAGSRFLTDAGYPVLHGSSFVLAVEFTQDGPRADAILSYGQSGDPESVHFTDQTELFARKQWRPVHFRADDVARNVRREYTVRSPAPSGAILRAADVADTVFVASPTGTRDTDRASILSALAQVRPGGTVQFAPGTYLMGGDIIRVTVPRITLLGHAEGSTLRGCDPGEFAWDDLIEFGNNCNAIELAAGQQTVRNLTFEHAFWALHVGCCWSDVTHMRGGQGGHLIEGNTFRSSTNALRVHGFWSEPSVIRNNTFLNNWHSVQIYGNTVHLLDNDISVPEPEKVQLLGFPMEGVHLARPFELHESVQGVERTCENNVIAGNRIDGVTEGIMVTANEPGITCRNNVIRDNTIAIRRTRPLTVPGFIHVHDQTDSTVIGVPLALRGVAGERTLEDNLIEGNVIVGAEGLGIEIRNASRNRIVNNTVTGVVRREPFPGNSFVAMPMVGGDPEAWRGANGAGMWISPGSEGNDVAGNVFNGIAGPSVVREGELETDDGVRLYYRVEGEGRDTVVVVHGGPSLGHGYLAPDLVPLTRGHAVVHYDQRGIGQSTPLTDPERLTVERHVQDLEALRVHLGLDGLALLGHSWGGMLAARYAAAHPQRVERILLLDPMAPAREPFMAMSNPRVQEMVSTRLDDAARARLDSLVSMAEVDDDGAHCRALFSLLTRIYFETPAATSRTRADFCAGSPETLRNRAAVDAAIFGSLGEWDVRHLLRQVSSPVLVVHGAGSAIPREAMEAWVEALPNARLITIDGGGHYLHVDRPEAFFPAAATFFVGGWPEPARERIR